MRWSSNKTTIINILLFLSQFLVLSWQWATSMQISWLVGGGRLECQLLGPAGSMDMASLRCRHLVLVHVGRLRHWLEDEEEKGGKEEEEKRRRRRGKGMKRKGRKGRKRRRKRKKKRWRRRWRGEEESINIV